MRLITRWLVSGVLLMALGSWAGAAPPNYSMEDFAKVRKLDAHVHDNVTDAVFLELARADNFELMSINVDYPDFPALEDQRAAALAQLKMDPARFHWATTFSMKWTIGLGRLPPVKSTTSL